MRFEDMLHLSNTWVFRCSDGSRDSWAPLPHTDIRKRCQQRDDGNLKTSVQRRNSSSDVLQMNLAGHNHLSHSCRPGDWADDSIREESIYVLNVFCSLTCTHLTSSWTLPVSSYLGVSHVTLACQGRHSHMIGWGGPLWNIANTKKLRCDLKKTKTTDFLQLWVFPYFCHLVSHVFKGFLRPSSVVSCPSPRRVRAPSCTCRSEPSQSKPTQD